jgi:hypothetical protein
LLALAWVYREELPGVADSRIRALRFANAAAGAQFKVDFVCHVALLGNFGIEMSAVLLWETAA